LQASQRAPVKPVSHVQAAVATHVPCALQPLAEAAVVQTPLQQSFVPEQSALLVQTLRQVSLCPEQAKLAPQAVPDGAKQVPEPAVPLTVVAPQSLSVQPVVDCVQELCGSIPGLTAAQVPFTPPPADPTVSAPLHERQPEQALTASLQQKPSTQLPVPQGEQLVEPDAQSVGTAQAAPWVFLVWQVLFAAQY
jgi:hypothetical protein